MTSLILYKKTSRVLTFTWSSSTDLNGNTILFTLKRKPGGSEDDSDALITSQTVVSSVTNLAQISLSVSDTNIQPGKYYADIKRVISSSDIIGYSSFNVEVKQTITQRSA